MKHTRPESRSRRAGFTITEMAISAVVLLILGAGIAQSSGALRQAMTGGQAADVQMTDAISALDAIRADLMSSGFVDEFPHTFAKGVAGAGFEIHNHQPAAKHAKGNDPAAGDDREIVFARPADADGDGVPDIDGVGNLVWDGAQYSFVRVDDATGTPVLERRIDGVTDRVLARNVERVQFETQTDDASVPAQTVRVTLHMRRTTPGGGVQKYFAQSMVKLRNE
ncbi:MAG: type II secretion system protein [Planctomycetota bacterium]|nr:MAG: type II secretion system protein [Planctomycetota bacterium]